MVTVHLDGVLLPEVWLVMRGASPAARAALWLLAGHLFVGLAHVAVLPPWEGFDETAHYSSVQQLADRREVPELYQARMSTDVERYSRLAPLPYSLESQGGITYRTFFAGSGEELARAREFIHGRPDEPRRYAPGGLGNWEAQHPPLYYLVLVPVYGSTRHMSWAMHLVTLRVASYALAWTALLTGVCACLLAVPSTLEGRGHCGVGRRSASAYGHSCSRPGSRTWHGSATTPCAPSSSPGCGG